MGSRKKTGKLSSQPKSIRKRVASESSDDRLDGWSAGYLKPYSQEVAERKLPAPVTDCMSMASRLAECYMDTKMLSNAPLYEAGKMPAASTKTVEGTFVTRSNGFFEWAQRSFLSYEMLDSVAANLEEVDSMLDDCGFYGEDGPDPFVFEIPEERESDAFWSAVSAAYAKSGIFGKRESEDGCMAVAIDVRALMQTFQCLYSHAAASHRAGLYWKGCSTALGEVVERSGKVAADLDAANDRIKKLEATLASRPTKGDVTRLEEKVASLQEDLAAANADASSLREVIDNQLEAAREAAAAEVSAKLLGQIDDLVRIQSETEDRAREAEGRAETAEKSLEQSERERLEEMEAADSEIERLKKAMADIAAATPASEQPAAITSCLMVSDLVSLPSNAVEALELAADVFDGRIAVADPAYDSASDYGGDTGEVWSVLRALATDGYDLLFGAGSVDVRSEFESRTGYEITLHASKADMTKAERHNLELSYEGRKYDIVPHVKGTGRKNGNCLRVHFAIDRDSSVIIIGHCGDHLKGRGSKKGGWA